MIEPIESKIAWGDSINPKQLKTACDKTCCMRFAEKHVEPAMAAGSPCHLPVRMTWLPAKHNKNCKNEPSTKILKCQGSNSKQANEPAPQNYYLSPQLIQCDKTCCLRAKPSLAIAIRLQKCCNLQPILIKTLSLAVTLKLASYFKGPECTGTVFSTSLWVERLLQACKDFTASEG